MSLQSLLNLKLSISLVMRQFCSSNAQECDTIREVSWHIITYTEASLTRCLRKRRDFSLDFSYVEIHWALDIGKQVHAYTIHWTKLNSRYVFFTNTVNYINICCKFSLKRQELTSYTHILTFMKSRTWSILRRGHIMPHKRGVSVLDI